MKWRYSPFSAATGSQEMVWTCGLTSAAVQGLALHAVAGDHRHLARFQEDHPAGVLQDGGDVGGDELLALAQADHHAAGVADAGRDDLVRLVGTTSRTTPCAPLSWSKVSRAASTSPIARGQIALDQVDDGLGVGIRVEVHAFATSARRLQLEEVFHDAVVDDDHLPGAARRADGRCGRWARRGWPSGCARCPARR